MGTRGMKVLYTILAAGIKDIVASKADYEVSLVLNSSSCLRRGISNHGMV